MLRVTSERLLRADMYERGLRLAVLDVVAWRPMRRRRGCKAGSSIFGTATLRNSNYTTRPLHDKYD